MSAHLSAPTTEAACIRGDEVNCNRAENENWEKVQEKKNDSQCCCKHGKHEQTMNTVGKEFYLGVYIFIQRGLHWHGLAGVSFGICSFPREPKCNLRLKYKIVAFLFRISLI